MHPHRGTADAAAAVAATCTVFVLSTAALHGACASTAGMGSLVMLRSGGMTVAINTTSGAYDVSVDGALWLPGGLVAIPYADATARTRTGTHYVRGGAASRDGGSDARATAPASVADTATLQQVAAPVVTNGSDVWGAYSAVELYWGSPPSTSVVLATSIRAYVAGVLGASELVAFRQRWPHGGSGGVGALAPGDDLGAPKPAVTGQPYPRAGQSAAGTTPVPASAPNASDVVAPFPTFFTSTSFRPGPHALIDDSDALPPATLNAVAFSGTMVASTYQTRWSGATSPPSGETTGMPCVLYDSAGRSLVFSSASNYLVSVHAAGPGAGAVSAGIKATVASLPAGFEHDTVLVGGSGINATLVAFGDRLLAKRGKHRVNPYALAKSPAAASTATASTTSAAPAAATSASPATDFVLTRLGYWTDNGAYYYHWTPGYTNHEDAILGVLHASRVQGIPLRYVQWDDWWAVQQTDAEGVIAWVPTNDSVPSGMTAWMGNTTRSSLYQPMYAANNVYVNDTAAYGAWAVDADAGNAIPLDSRFYRATFRNGSHALMSMFEIDWLSYADQRTTLTNSNVSTGALWLHAMDDAAVEAGVSIQICMANPVHVLMSSELHAVTNGRATGDNVRRNHLNLLPLGMSALLFHAVGIWPSRDNVFTSVNETGCAQNYWNQCEAADYRLQNVAAVLSGGPYGPSDGVEYLNRDMIMRACRADGVLLRPDKPVTVLDAALLAAFDDQQDRRVWATHSDVAAAAAEGASGGDDGGGGGDIDMVGPLYWRWSYVLSVDLNVTLRLTLADLEATPGTDYVSYEFWAANGSLPVAVTAVRAQGGSLVVPVSPPPPPLSWPRHLAYGNGGTYQVLAPVLPGGWVVLGEARKIVVASSRRYSSVGGGAAGALRVALRAASGEAVAVWVLPPAETRRVMATGGGVGGGGGGDGDGGGREVGVAAFQVDCAAGTCAGEDCDVALALTCALNGGGDDAEAAAPSCTCGPA